MTAQTRQDPRPGDSPASEPASPASQPTPPAERVADLAATSLFSLLEPDELVPLARAFEVATYGPGQLVAREGRRDRSLWVITEGGVALDRRRRSGGVVHVGYRGYGGVIGTQGVFADRPRDTSAVALQPTTMLHIDKSALWGVLQDRPEIFDRLVLDDEIREQLDAPDGTIVAPGERVVAVYRRHWSALVKSMGVPLLAVAASMFAAGGIASLVTSPALIFGLAVVGLGLPFALIAWAWLDYRYDLLIVTSRRVVHIDRTPLIRSHRAEAALERVQDVVVTVPHLAARLLGYGTVMVQTAGSRGAIRFHTTPNPEQLREVVFEEANRVRAGAHQERQHRVVRQVASAISKVDSDPEPPGLRNIGRDENQDVPGPRPSDATLAAMSFVGRFLPKTRIETEAGVVWRKHWWVLLQRSGLILVALIAALAGILHTRLGGPVPVSVWFGLAAGLLVWLLFRYEDWRNDLYILTDDHIVDIERRPLGMFGERRQARLDQIQDIQCTVPHPLATLLNYGNVHVETAAESGRFTFDHVHDPTAVQEEIFARIDAMQARADEEDQRRRADELTQWFQAYHEATSSDQDSPRNATAPELVT